MSAEGERVSFLNRELPPSFQLLMVTIPPGVSRAYERDEWRDALVVIEHGEIELECEDRRRLRFTRGDVLCLFGLAVRALHNRKREPAVLVAVSRRRQSANPG